MHKEESICEPSPFFQIRGELELELELERMFTCMVFKNTFWCLWEWVKYENMCKFYN